MTYDEFLSFAGMNSISHPQWRVGQTIYNSLYQVRPHIAEYIVGTVRDPFYWKDGDERLEVFLDWLKEEWEK